MKIYIFTNKNIFTVLPYFTNKKQLNNLWNERFVMRNGAMCEIK